MCNAHDPTRDGADEDDVSGALHERCKRWCDDYFYIPARKEHRGVGGIFFDDMSDDTSPSDASPSDAEAFTRAVARAWTLSYEPIVERRRDAPFDEANEKWHHQRRGRYVEFNLLYDRGVRFGLGRRAGRIHHGLRAAPRAMGLRRRAARGIGGGEAGGGAQEPARVVERGEESGGWRGGECDEDGSRIATRRDVRWVPNREKT